MNKEVSILGEDGEFYLCKIDNKYFVGYLEDEKHITELRGLEEVPGYETVIVGKLLNGKLLFGFWFSNYILPDWKRFGGTPFKISIQVYKKDNKTRKLSLLKKGV